MNPVLPLSLLIPLTVVVVLFGGWLGWRSTAAAPSKLRKSLLALRVLALLSLALFLLNPGRWQSVNDEVARIWAVMVDGSGSMTVAEGEGTRLTVAETLRKTIAEGAGDAGVELRHFSFAGELQDLAADEVAKAGGDKSDLHSSAEALLTQLSSQGEPLAGVFVLGDGRQTYTPRNSSFALRAQALQVPFYGVLIGGEYITNDLELATPRKMVTAFPGQTVQITAMVKSQGLDDVEAELTLLDAAGATLETTNLKIKSSARTMHTFSIKAPEESAILTMKLSEAEGEMRVSNNLLDVRLRILHDKAKVFIAEGAPYWDSKFLAQLMRQQKHMEVNSVHRLSDTRWFRIDSGESTPHESDIDVFPDTKQELMAYDLIIFGKNSEHFLTGGRIANLRSFVKDQGGAVLFSRSKPYTGVLPDLEALEPVTWATGVTAQFGLRPSADGQAAGLFGQALPAPDSAVWASLPELKDAHRIDVVKPFTRVLAHGEMGNQATQGRFPLLMIRRYGQGVTGLVNADGLWKWDFFPEAREQGNMYQEFWIQMIHWMLSYSEFLPGQDYSLNLSASTVNPGTPIAVRMAYRGTAKPDLPQVEVTSPELDEPLRLAPAELPSADGRLRWGTTFTPEKPGSYQLRLIAAKPGDASLPEASVTVTPPPGEMDQLSADREFMRDLCESSGGKLVEADRLEAFLAGVLKPQVPEALDRGVEWNPYWMRWFTPVLVLLLLAAEWWLRRRNGME